MLPLEILLSSIDGVVDSVGSRWCVCLAWVQTIAVIDVHDMRFSLFNRSNGLPTLTFEQRLGKSKTQNTFEDNSTV